MIETFVALTCLSLARQTDSPTISAAERDKDGFLVHAVRSKLQAAATEIRVLLPDRIEPGKQYRVAAAVMAMACSR